MLLGEARVIDLTANPIDTEATLSVTDTVVIVYETAGNLKIAKDIYIVDSYEAMDVSDIESAVSNIAIRENTFVDATTEADGTLTLTQNLEVQSGATLYIDGNLDIDDQTVTTSV